MSSVLFYQLFSCVLFLAFGIFALDSTLDEPGFSTFLCILILLNALIPTFVYCYFADTYSTDLLDVGDVFYNSFWYILPVKQQILMIIPIQRAQLRKFTRFIISISFLRLISFLFSFFF